MNSKQSNILKTLRRDHVNLAQLFTLINEEIGRVHTDQSNPNFETLTLILEYCIDYPCHFHHPMEDLIFEKLIHRAPALKSKILDITAEHKALLQTTESFANTIAGAIESGTIKPVHTHGHEFLQQYRQHMQIEDAELFPDAERHLTQSDWSEIEMKAKIPVDPLFSEHVREAYLALKRRIVTYARQNKKG